MPLYPYRCTQCGHRFEKIQNFSAEPEHECPKCGGPLERLLTAPRFNFKGAGWYVNDYAAKSSEPASESGTGASATSEPKSDTSESPKTSTASESTTSTPASAPSTPPASTSGSTT